MAVAIEEQLTDYDASVHGSAVNRYAEKNAAVCVDCHTTHPIDTHEADATKLLITRNCGGSHKHERKNTRVIARSTTVR
uniref:Uncharacterized protein n=1 Tax=Candidatus Kentrum eta TaxID=2126337 RepID=A0A450VI90_9GAMM|nr:MAG: hypothetical protein BECKH772B_GA0070898_104253 [Candidatus Kentron sp. H]VFK04475.1 MAG: hypothetical protein BECKH772A_GA0070896_104203 [Candidatus Kentron sp. H]VFK07521.1 MAG: hypothetical protein BECKH772C_GA0070978_104283 [Candidatus Kentron sp. H]